MKRYPEEIREYALELLKQGLKPKTVAKILYKEFKIIVPPNTISKWKERYLTKKRKKEYFPYESDLKI